MQGPSYPNLSPMRDPRRDHVAICHRLIGYDFPWEMNRALELGVLRTFCVPRIAQLLAQTEEFLHRPQKRYDDTSLILGNIMKWGYDSPQGRAAIAQMNRIHRRYAIANEDFLYVLSVLVFEPIRWNQRFGWRSFTTTEKQALFYFWQAVGHRMGIQDIPATYTEFAAFNHTYEVLNFRYAPANEQVGNAVIALMQTWVPDLLAPLVPSTVRAILDEPMRQALGWSSPSRWHRASMCQILRWSRRLARWLPSRRRSRFVVDTPNVTYRDGYQIHQLGPEAAPTAPSATPRCPFLRMQAFLKARA